MEPSQTCVRIVPSLSSVKLTPIAVTTAIADNACMRFYYRTGERTGISFGPIGFFVLVAVAFWLIFAVVRVVEVIWPLFAVIGALLVIYLVIRTLVVAILRHWRR